MAVKNLGNEKIIKEWEYAKSKKMIGRTRYTLTLTDKRLISVAASKKATVRNDIALDSITGVGTTAGYNRRMKIAGIVLCCLVITLLIGVILIVVASKKRTLGVTIYGAFHENNIGGNGAAGIKNQKIRVKVNATAADEIASSLGVLILAR